MTEIVKQIERAVTVLSVADKLEEKMLQMEQAECPTVHHFYPGTYVREMRAKAGTLIVGHSHKEAHACALISGSLALIKDAHNYEIINAPLLFLAKPGRKIGFVLKDVVFLNVHKTSETDLDRLEALLIDKSDSFNKITNNQPHIKITKRG